MRQRPADAPPRATPPGRSPTTANATAAEQDHRAPARPRSTGAPAATAAATAAAASGTRNLRAALAGVVRRQATAVRSPREHEHDRQRNRVAVEPRRGRRASLCRSAASEISGKNVPQKITKQSPTSTTLLSRKTASRESSESSRPSDRSCVAPVDDQPRPSRARARRSAPGTGRRASTRRTRGSTEDPGAHQESAEDREDRRSRASARRSRSSASRASPGPSPSAAARCRSATASAPRSRPGPRPSSRPSPARSQDQRAPSRIPIPRHSQASSAKRRVARDPLGVERPRDQRADRERERDREQRVPE